MTTLEKRQRIIQKIEKMPEEFLDDLEKLIEEIETTKELTGEERFETLLKMTNEKYKKVWEALA